jgi:hypothetical protein
VDSRYSQPAGESKSAGMTGRDSVGRIDGHGGDDLMATIERRAAWLGATADSLGSGRHTRQLGESESVQGLLQGSPTFAAKAHRRIGVPTELQQSPSPKASTRRTEVS